MSEIYLKEDLPMLSPYQCVRTMGKEGAGAAHCRHIKCNVVLTVVLYVYDTALNTWVAADTSLHAHINQLWLHHCSMCMQQRTFYVGVTAQMIICTSYWSTAHPGSVSQRFLSTKIFLVRIMFILKVLKVQEKWEKIFRLLLICVSALFWLVTKDQNHKDF